MAQRERIIMIEKMLQMVAETIGGTLVVCDDGFVIESYIEGMRADYIFDEEGEMERVEIKGFKDTYRLK